MAVEVNEIQRLIDKHQTQADNYHDMAKTYHRQGLHHLVVSVDKEAHLHEVVAAELRLLIHDKG